MAVDNEKLDIVLRDFLTLKKLRRTGWQLRGIRDGESIADHCFGVVYLSYFLAPLVDENIDRNKAVSIAIVHEIGETRVGDIPYVTLKYFKNKDAMETMAIGDVLEPLGKDISDESLKLFREFEDGSTLEGRFVKAIDKLDMLVTAAEYEKAGYSGLKDFWDNKFTFKTFEEFPRLSSFAQYLLDKRSQRIAGQL